jgi:hypothetical protein
MKRHHLILTVAGLAAAAVVVPGAVALAGQTDGTAGIAVAGANDPRPGGNVVYDDDFEKGVTWRHSPTSLPASRIQSAADPTRKRGKVAKLTFQAGDDYRTSPGTQPRTFISNRTRQVQPGETVSQAFGILTTAPSIDASFAQNISDKGPVWMLQTDRAGNAKAIVNGQGSVSGIGFKIEPNRWYDFRVDMKYTASGGYLRVSVNGKQVYNRTGLHFKPAQARFDAGIYNRKDSDKKRTRVVYLSNWTIGRL